MLFIVFVVFCLTWRTALKVPTAKITVAEIVPVDEDDDICVYWNLACQTLVMVTKI